MDENMMSLLGGAIPGMGWANLASGALSSIAGLFQKGKANKLMKGLQYPTYEVPSDIKENKNIATGIAGQGLPSEQYQKQIRDIQRQQVAALRASSDRRGGLANIPSIMQGTTDATLNLNAADAAQKLANQKVLLGVNSELGGYKDKAFQWNKANKYNMDRDYAMSLMGSGNQNLFGGIDKLAAGGLSLFGGGKKSQQPTGQYTL